MAEHIDGQEVNGLIAWFGNYPIFPNL